MYIQLISVHGLIRADRIEMGRDADTGGQVRYVLELARALAAHEQVEQVDLFTRLIRDPAYSEDYARPVESLGPKARIVRIPCGNGYLRKEALWPFLDEFADRMIEFTRREKRHPAVVHGHYADAGHVAAEVAAALGAPFVFTGHSLGRDKQAYLLAQDVPEERIDRDFNMRRRIQAEEHALCVADMVIASTHHEVASQYGQYTYGPTTRFEVIPPGISLDRFFPYYEYDLNPGNIEEEFKQARIRMLDELNRFHFQTVKPMVLAVCRPDQRKNIGSLVQAYGEDKELQAMANLAIFAGIRKSIENMPESEQAVLTDILLMMDRYDLYGRLAIPKRHDSEKEVPALYRLAASTRGVFVNPAFVEPFGLTLLEASAVGLPFVATHNGGPQDIVDNCGSGILVDVTRQGEMGAAIKKLLTHQELWHDLSTNGINGVRAHYTWENHAHHYVDALMQLRGVPQIMPVGSSAASALPPRIADADYVLVSDIDNTLTGDAAGLEELKAWLEDNRHRIAFGVASGRPFDLVRQAITDFRLPEPDFCITAVGTEIYLGESETPDEGWADHISHRWDREQIEAALAGVSGIVRQQETHQRQFKVSYDLAPGARSMVVLKAIKSALAKVPVPHTLVFSHGKYFDVLAARASKGRALRYLALKWGIPLCNVITAGDSGNDEDMLRGQMAGIVVGNATRELDHLRAAHRIYFAKARHAAGVLEGLRAYAVAGKEAKSTAPAA